MVEMPSTEEEAAIGKFLKAFNFEQNVNHGAIAHAMFSSKHMNDLNAAKEYIDGFLKKCERRDPSGTKSLQKKMCVLLNESPNMVMLLDFLVRCRQAHLFYGNQAISNKTPSSVQSSPFQRRSASRTRVLSSLTADGSLPTTVNLNETTRSRANTSFMSYDSRLGMERPLGPSRAKSPFRITNSPGNMSSTTISASNQLFSANGLGNTPIGMSGVQWNHSRDGYQKINGNISTIRSPSGVAPTVPLHARVGSAICQSETSVCESLLCALIGIESRLFRSDGTRKMIVTSTASLTTTHAVIAQRVLSCANLYMQLTHKDTLVLNTINEPIKAALIASIRFVMGDYTADIDALRRHKDLTFTRILPLIDLWNGRLELLAKFYQLRKLEQMDILDSIYVIYISSAFNPSRKYVLEKVLEYTLGAFCKQLVGWIKTGDIPCSKWVVGRDAQLETLQLVNVPVILHEKDAKILLEIGKSLPRFETTSDEDLAEIDKATRTVSAGLNPNVILERNLTEILCILRDVVCGIVMRTVTTSGKLKEHLRKATSFFFLTDPRFTNTLYCFIKEASMGLPVGTTSLSKQTVSSALATALNSIADKSGEKKEKMLQFRLDSLTTIGNTPNVSSRLQFVKPLLPKYEPNLDIMKPIFNACDEHYASIFHMIWAIDLARLSSQEVSATIPPMIRFLELNYSLRENAWSILGMISHIFYIINATLARIRNTIELQLKKEIERLMAAIDDRCVNVDDVIEEHLRFVKRVFVIVYLSDNDIIEQQLSVFLQTAFEAQEMVKDFEENWQKLLEESGKDLNVLKAKMAENCKKRAVGVRVLLDKLNTIQRKLIDNLDQQLVFGNDALLE